MPSSAAVLGDLEYWKEGLVTAGVELRTAGPVDLVVAPAELTDTALERGPHALILEGDAASAAGRAGYATRSYFPIPPGSVPRAWLPLDSRAVAAYALQRWTIPPTATKRVRNALLKGMVDRGRAPLRSSWVTVAARTDPLPALVRAAAPRIGVADPSWFLAVGAGESLDSRGVFHLFEGLGGSPKWVVKFARRPGLDDAFARDRAGLGLAAAGGPLVRAHAPTLVATFEQDGLVASVETAAPGAALSALLRARGPRARKLRIVERVASWILQIGVDSAAPGAVDAERQRLAASVLPEWRSFGFDVDLLPRIADVPGVLQHNDLWSENVIVDGDSFTVVDWEDARRHGLPLWDLVYFLADALALVDDALDGPARHEHFASLFKGTARSSPVLFDWMRRAARACSVPDDSVGPIVTACWLSQVLMHVTRGEDAERFAVHRLSQLPEGEQWATLWLDDPALGPDWSAWRP